MKTRRFYINHRLLKFTLVSFDYDKINNRHYFNRNKNKLLLNYYYNITKDLSNTIIFARKKCGPNWIKVLHSIGLENVLIETFGSIDKDKLWNVANGNKCLECGSLIAPNQMFCSNTCSNRYKCKDVTYIRNLSDAVRKIHENESSNKKKQRYAKIKKSLSKTNNSLDAEERSRKYSNKQLKYTSFCNLTDRFPKIKFLFDEDFYYANKYLPVKCKECGNEWEMTKTTGMARFTCRKCEPYKKHQTQSTIFNYINSHVKSREDDKRIIAPKEIDIVVPELNFGIEFDGLLSHSYGKSKVSYYNNFDINSKYHLDKTKMMENQNYQLFHIFESEFMDPIKQKIWFSIINNKLNLNKRIYARNCRISEISKNESSTFIENNHMQGDCQSSIKIGLYYDNDLISVMTFRKHKKYQWEIARFCTKLNVSVIGGASKLLKYFERMYAPSSILSYANRRWSQGHLYEMLGFEFVENTSPNYFYFRENENILYSREKFQKHKLCKILDSFDSNLTERENMLNNGFRIIYDCGNKKYIKRYKKGA